MNRTAFIAIILGVILLAGLLVKVGSKFAGSRDGEKEDAGSPKYSPWVQLPEQGASRRERRKPTLSKDDLSPSSLGQSARFPPGALPGERTMIFASADDYGAFIAAAEEAGFKILGSIDAFNAVRVGAVRGDEDLANLLEKLGIEGTDADLGGNFAVATPRPPGEEERDPLNPEPFNNQTLEWLGLSGIDLSAWGEGIRIGVLDGGIAPIFSGQEISNTLVHPSAPDPEGAAAMHGTAVSSIMVSEDPRIPGLAPAAELIGFSVMGENGLSDTFTLAEGIVAAVDAGVDLINASLGSAGDSLVVRQAVQYAADHGVLIVASAGNEQLSEVAFPARYPETIAVGAIDALGRQLTFSNSGDALGIGAPGQDIYAFGASGAPVSFSGTSASAPFVTAAIAAVMSQEPNLSARQAADLIIEYADEAGAPGFDTHYGYGNLNLARVLNRNESNRRDIAVASHYVTEDASGHQVLQVIVENRGTSIASGTRLNVELDGGSRVAIIPPVQPNAIFAKDFPLIPSRIDPDQPFPVESRVTGSGDVNERNDTLSTDISDQFSD